MSSNLKTRKSLNNFDMIMFSNNSNNKRRIGNNRRLNNDDLVQEDVLDN